MKSNVYTRGGDKGSTSLIGGTRVLKSDIRLEAYGTIDELNSFIGLLISTVPTNNENEFLLRIQHKLFNVGGYLATDQEQTEIVMECKIEEVDIEFLEKRIDELDETMPKLRAFILPGGSAGAATAHVCRSICRRAERRIIELASASIVDPLLISYINRLSDYLFVLARRISLDGSGKEIIWNNRFE